MHFFYILLSIAPFQTGESVQPLQRSGNIENVIFGIEKNAKRDLESRFFRRGWPIQVGRVEFEDEWE